MKRTHISFTFLIGFFFLFAPLYGQETSETAESSKSGSSETIDKALNKAEQKLDKLINSFGKKKKKKKNQAESSSSADEAVLEAGAEPVSNHDPSDVEPINDAPQQDHRPEVNPSSSPSLTDIPPFPDEVFDDGPFTEKGIVGKGPFGTKAAFWIKESHITHTSVKMKVHQRDTLTFDNFGQSQNLRSWQDQMVSMLGFSQNQSSHTFSLTVGDSTYTFKQGERQGYKMKNPGKEFYEGITEEQAETFAQDLADAMHTSLKKLGTQTISGWLCEVWESETKNEDGIVIMRSRMWYWRGIAIQTHSIGMGIEETTTTLEIKPLSRVDANTFRIPSHVSFKEMPYSFGN